MRAVESGFDVVGFDVDTTRAKRLSDGDSFVEDVSDERLGKALRSGRYRATSDASALADFDVAVIDVPTPLTDGDPNLSFVVEAARTLSVHLRRGATVVLESTTYPGTTEELVLPALEEGSGLAGGPRLPPRLQP